jgi:DNA repair exonuclease SbcCD ATPase subunit
MNDRDDIRIKTTTTLKNGRVKPTLDIDLLVDNEWQPYRRLSGGQTLFADLYFLHKMIKTVGGLGFIILDETFKYFDAATKELAFSMLQELPVFNIFLIIHGGIPEGDYQLVEVTRSNGSSEYKLFKIKSI